MNRFHAWRRILFQVCGCAVATSAVAASNDFMTVHPSLSGGNLAVSFDLRQDFGSYYVLQESTNFSVFSPNRMALFGGSNIWDFSVTTSLRPRLFWRTQRISLAAAQDADGDGMNDAYELRHGLNPLNPADASQPSIFTDTSGVNLTWLQLQQFQQTNSLGLYDAVSREVSSFNFGQATANFEAISREVSLFNVPAPDTDNDGITDEYEVNHGLNPLDANDASQPSGFTADLPGATGVMMSWHDLYRFHFGKNTLLYDAVSREVSVSNNP